MPRNATKKELEKFFAPTMVIAAENDVLFPGEEVIKRSKEIFQNVVKTELLNKCSHMFFHSKSDVEKVNTLIIDFIRD